MAYENVDYGGITDARLEKVFRHADMILSDVYSMFLFDAPPATNGGRGNFSIALILLCVIDGLAREVTPTAWQVREHEDRFKRAIREHLPWQKAPRWVTVAEAARVLYLEVRNPLAHELGRDKLTGARPPGWDEPAIHKWHPVHRMTADQLDATTTWPSDWPILSTGANKAGNRRYELSSAALYWAVKNLTQKLATDAPLIAHAVASRQSAQAAGMSVE